MSKVSQSGTEDGADLAAQVRRSPMEMVCDILAVVSGGPTKPTHILYKANMSWKVLSSYLDFLTTRGMLDRAEQEGGKRSTYTLTLRGRQILKLYEGLKGSLNGTLSFETAQELGQMVEKGTVTGPRVAVSSW